MLTVLFAVNLYTLFKQDKLNIHVNFFEFVLMCVQGQNYV